MTENLDAAFPVAFIDQSDSKFDGQQIVELGMSIRDYFAGKAMEALVGLGDQEGDIRADLVASVSYQIADAMMAQREKVLDELLRE